MAQVINENRPEREKKLYEELVNRIQEMIRNGELKPGDRLPSERDMAQRFRVSRNSVREAILTLAESGMVESRRGDGTYLCATETSILIDSLAHAIQTQRGRLQDIFEFRRLVEPHIAKLAASHIKEFELDQLKVLVCDQDRRILAGEDGADEDMAFHLLLARISGNQVIYDVLIALHTILLESRSEFIQTETRKRTSVTDHLHIIDALEKRDTDAAHEAMRVHLNRIEHAIFDDEA